MIKRFTVVPGPAWAAAPEGAWRDALAAGAGAPVDARPVRVAVCRPLEGIEAGGPPAGVGIEWFRDRSHLDRYVAWLTPAGADPGAGAPGVAPRPGAPGTATGPAGIEVVTAEEVVLRGADWLAGRWARRGTELKHMALARRAEGLTPAEFSARWRSRAGTVGRPGSAGAVVIPEVARGRAYVQNHPLDVAPGAGAPAGTAVASAGTAAGGDVTGGVDAVNEVYVGDLGALRARVAWLAEHLDGGADDDLVGEHRFLAVLEDVIE